jgi:hypothetical protein
LRRARQRLSRGPTSISGRTTNTVCSTVKAELENRGEKIIMRSSIKVSLTGLLIAGALAFSAVGADAMGTGGGGAGGGGNGGNIVGGNPQAYRYSGGGRHQGGGYQANTDRQFGDTYHNSHGGYGAYHGGY